ncbi:DUF1996 domain-containing protein [Nonomuraea sediminis]|uniref:DUF1996 domain-containing protein n=1 Tax=Nonomuraea sediminis TaxID=2835864 RepID=UPI002029FC90|nr:DUF1996 domain-containing protein [Nonomuraea sediminis]
MRRSRRMAAAMTALAVTAGGLVSAAVIGVGPARADHCDPATQGKQALRATQDPDGQNPDGQDPTGQDPEQDPTGQDQAPLDQGSGGGGAVTAPRFGGRMVLAPTPTPTDSAEPTPSGTASRTGSAEPTQTAEPSDEPSPSPTREQRRRQPTQSATPTQTATPTETADHGNECADLGPFVTDFIDIRQVPPVDTGVRFGRNGSRGSFVSACGTNQNGHNNPDNFIVAPGVSNGAHHLHDYVGNLSTNGFSTDESLAAAGTTCRFGDRSTYFWPVLRDRKIDANLGDKDGNVGQVLRARTVTLLFRGNPLSKVSPMPRFLRIITGDAKAATNGGANARAQWTCTGFGNRITGTKYPLCPRFSRVVRILDFPSCWDGQNTDSANHRTHIVFPGQDGACPQGTRAVPQLRMILTYSVPQGPSFAVDAFPEQKHNPVTDHADFANVMPDRLMAFVVSCLNRGRRC